MLEEKPSQRKVFSAALIFCMVILFHVFDVQCYFLSQRNKVRCSVQIRRTEAAPTLFRHRCTDVLTTDALLSLCLRGHSS